MLDIFGMYRIRQNSDSSFDKKEFFSITSNNLLLKRSSRIVNNNLLSGIFNVADRSRLQNPQILDKKDDASITNLFLLAALDRAFVSKPTAALLSSMSTVVFKKIAPHIHRGSLISWYEMVQYSRRTAGAALDSSSNNGENSIPPESLHKSDIASVSASAESSDEESAAASAESGDEESAAASAESGVEESAAASAESDDRESVSSSSTEERYPRPSAQSRENSSSSTSFHRPSSTSNIPTAERLWINELDAAKLDDLAKWTDYRETKIRYYEDKRSGLQEAHYETNAKLERITDSIRKVDSKLDSKQAKTDKCRHQELVLIKSMKRKLQKTSDWLDEEERKRARTDVDPTDAFSTSFPFGFTTNGSHSSPASSVQVSPTTVRPRHLS